METEGPLATAEMKSSNMQGGQQTFSPEQESTVNNSMLVGNLTCEDGIMSKEKDIRDRTCELCVCVFFLLCL